jgi:hypothetical protein
MCVCLTRSAEARRKPGQQAVLRGSVRISAGLPKLVFGDEFIPRPKDLAPPASTVGLSTATLRRPSHWTNALCARRRTFRRYQARVSINWQVVIAFECRSV